MMCDCIIEANTARLASSLVINGDSIAGVDNTLDHLRSFWFVVLITPRISFILGLAVR